MGGFVIANRLRAQVCARHGVGPRSIHSRCRLAYLVAARHELIWLIRQSTTWSTTQIGRYMGMDHSSILHAIKKHEERRGQREQTVGRSHIESDRDRSDFGFRGAGRTRSHGVPRFHDPRLNGYP
jgi:chromosomal replication initiation ATPase DnaA